ncbi:two-component sensor histidine kinase [Amycolatopsis suaedae]|uniref:histidine kinase n=1 Tax=Amycolatopsis suaedae TaxID=2510978 RepID=A0A4Q7JAU5_9PSEU|nr:two-component sensor histidine kinase [Amycolatopsis suaedae]
MILAVGVLLPLVTDVSVLITLSAAVAVACVLWRGRSAVLASTVAAVVSAAATAVLPFASSPPLRNVAGLCLLLETLALMALLVTAVRRAGPAAGLAGLALTALPLRACVDSPVPPDALEVVVLCLLGSVAASTAAVAGGYLRSLDRKRMAAVVETRRAQRLAFARDLHDFVGHDLTGIVLEAQAAQVSPERAMAALKHIEQVGLSALTSMDHTVRTLHGEEPDPGAPAGGLADLAELVGRFGSGDEVAVRLHVEPGLAEAVSRESGAVAYRVVVEALTNVRRHAGGVTAVDVRVGTAGDGLEVVVTDDGTGATGGRSGRRGGLGLVGLAERVRTVGGTLDAGPAGRAGGWRVRVTLPMSPAAVPS